MLMLAETVFQEISGTLFSIAFFTLVTAIAACACASRLYRILNNLREINQQSKDEAIHSKKAFEVLAIRLKSFDDNLEAVNAHLACANKMHGDLNAAIQWLLDRESKK